MSDSPRNITVMFRTRPAIRDALAERAAADNRSVSNLVEQVVTRWLAAEHYPDTEREKSRGAARRGSSC